MFNTGNGTYSLSDIAAVTGSNRNNDGGFGGENGWWIILLLLLACGGWGNNGNGVFRGGNGGATEGYILASDFSNIERKLDGVNNGLCDGFYAVNSAMLTGFNTLGAQVADSTNSIQSTLCQGFNGINTGLLTATNTLQNGINNLGITTMQNTNALSAQLAECCCENRAAIADIKYQMATDTCALNTAAANNTRDIIDSQNANARAILDAIQQGKIDAMQDKIATLTAEKQSLQFAASQAAQNAYLVNELRPCPSPAYIVPNPYCCDNNYTVYRNTCGCGC